MAWRFRKKIKLIPGVYLNFSKNGVSTTIGPRGFSFNVGSDGTYLNTGIPGTGLYNRTNLSGNSNTQVDTAKANEIAERLNNLLQQSYDGAEQIKSQSIELLTSQGLDNLKQTIITARKEYDEISNSISLKTNERTSNDNKLNKLQKSFFKFLYKKRIERLTFEAKELEEEINELNEQLNLTSVELNIKHDETFESLYRNVEQAYQLIINCNKIWDITTTKDIDKIQRRTAAESEVRRIDTKATIEQSGLINSKRTPLKLHNKNGGDIYLYPGFIMIHEQLLDFAILDYAELDLDFINTKFIETESVPQDTEIVGQTWAKCNKDGSPDKRFKGNYQIPIVKYGQLTFTSKTGLKESFLLSNPNYSNLFFTALKDYISAIKTANALIKEFK